MEIVLAFRLISPSQPLEATEIRKGSFSVHKNICAWMGGAQEENKREFFAGMKPYVYNPTDNSFIDFELC